MKRHLPDWVAGYLELTGASESPTQFHLWTAISTLGGVLRRKVFFDMGYWKWYPNFYILFVAPPGICAKSTSIGIGTDLLRQVKGIHLGPSSATWHGLVKMMSNFTSRYQYNGKQTSMTCITIAPGEFGTFFDPRDPQMVDVLVDLYDGRDGAFDRVTAGQPELSIVNPWINMISATTPSWISDNFTPNMVGGGLSSRFIFVYGSTKRHLEAYPKEQIPSTQSELKDKLLSDLTAISNMVGEFTLTPDARAWGRKWYEQHYQDSQKKATNDRMLGHIARKQTHLHKVAMALSSARRDNLIIETKDLIHANELLTSTEKNIQSVFKEIDQSQDSKLQNELVALVKAYGQIDRASLYRLVFNTTSSSRFNQALESCIHAGKILARQRGNTLNLTHGGSYAEAIQGPTPEVNLEKTTYGE